MRVGRGVAGALEGDGLGIAVGAAVPGAAVAGGAVIGAGVATSGVAVGAVVTGATLGGAAEGASVSVGAGALPHAVAMRPARSRPVAISKRVTRAR